MSIKEQSVFCLIFGRKGSGKTTLIRKMIKKNKKKKTFLIIDKLDKYTADYTFKTAIDINNYLRSTAAIKSSVRLLSSVENEIVGSILSAYTRGNVVVVMDEADSTFGTHVQPEITDVILRGRNQGIDFILASLRPHRIHIDARNQCDYVYCFRIVNQVMLKAITGEFGTDEILEAMENLKGHDYLKYDVNENTIEIYREKAPKKRTSNKGKSKTKKTA